MTTQPTVTQRLVEEFLGDVAPLAGLTKLQYLELTNNQVADVAPLAKLTALSALYLSGNKIADVTPLWSLRCFVRDYQSNILFPLEWPAICRAYGHASRYEIRELIELDRQLDHESLLQNFATASQRVGKAQLKRLRPLREQRLVQRYLHAVQTGEAHAWHTVVYGVILSLYSLPLRHYLLSYAQQTTLGFIRSAAGPLRLTGIDCEDLMSEEGSGFAEAVNRLLLPAVGPRPMIG